MISLFGTKWGQTRYQRGLEYVLYWVKLQFYNTGVGYDEERIAEICAPLREICDEAGMRKLAIEGLWAVLFIRSVGLFGSWEVFEYLNAEMEAGRLPRKKNARHVVAAFMFRLISFERSIQNRLTQFFKSTREYLCRLIGTTWYERSITVPMAAGVVFAIYVVFASAALVDAKEFWFHSSASIAPAVEMDQLAPQLVAEAKELAKTARKGNLQREALRDFLKNASRYYELAIQYGEEEHRVWAAKLVSIASDLLEIKEGVDWDENHDKEDLQPPPLPPSFKLWEPREQTASL